jgi:hypothetical protein
VNSAGQLPEAGGKGFGGGASDLTARVPLRHGGRIAADHFGLLGREVVSRVSTGKVSDPQAITAALKAQITKTLPLIRWRNLHGRKSFRDHCAASPYHQARSPQRHQAFLKSTALPLGPGSSPLDHTVVVVVH